MPYGWGNRLFYGPKIRDVDPLYLSLLAPNPESTRATRTNTVDPRIYHVFEDVSDVNRVERIGYGVYTTPGTGGCISMLQMCYCPPCPPGICSGKVLVQGGIQILMKVLI